MSYNLLDDVSSPATSGTVKAFKQVHTVYAFGTFNGSTVKLQCSPDGVNWFDDPTRTFNVAGSASFELASDVRMRAVITGGTGTGLNVVVV